METSMINHKRRKRMLGLLTEHSNASVEQLCQWLNASAATVRRDISWLAERNMLNRILDGAERLAPKRNEFALSGENFPNSLDRFPAKKRAIERHAASMCEDADFIINDAATT